MLEPHLAEIKHQEESKLQHPEPQACKNFLMPYYTEKTGGLLCHQMLAPNLLGRHPADQQVSTKCHAVFPQLPLG
jgi:hypothetical protein